MKSFSKFINEFPVKTGEPVSSRDKDREQEWESIRDDKKFLKFMVKIKPSNLLYEYGSTYYLTDKDRNYIAHIDVVKKENLYITHGNSNKRGYYSILCH